MKSTNPLWALFIWILNLEGLVKPRSQCMHLWGFKPSWVYLIWSFNFELVLNALPHNLQTCSFIPLWIFVIWFFNAQLFTKPCPHSSHIWSLMPSWTHLICFWRSFFSLLENQNWVYVTILYYWIVHLMICLWSRLFKFCLHRDLCKKNRTKPEIGF